MKAYCTACEGRSIACKGGGNLRCADRNPLPSVVSAILDTYGGIRFVVTHRKDLHHHVRIDELAIVVRGLRVHEPIAWNDIAGVVDRAELEVKNWIARGIPNDPLHREIMTMYRLRCSEQDKNSLDLTALAYT